MKNDDHEDDEFWAVAMSNNNIERRPWAEGNNHDNDDDDDDDDIVGSEAKAFRYVIPNTDDNNVVTLNLRPLPATDGIWSPVGADAWYASALLSGLLMTPIQTKGSGEYSLRHPLSSLYDCAPSTTTSSNNNDIDGTSKPSISHRNRIILELGSGAVGLSGLVCTYALQHYHTTSHYWPGDNTHFTVYLTDNDPPVLEQLKKNVDENRNKLIGPLLTMSDEDGCQDQNDNLVQVKVSHLDWNDEEDEDNSTTNTTTTTTSILSNLLPNDIALVIGSELVYTQETADACVKLLLRLLKQHPNVEIYIVQVMDRYGWTETVIPTLEAANVIVETFSIPFEIHDLATTMIPMGGTLDRHAYGYVRIYNPKVREC